MGLDHPANTLAALCTIGGIAGYVRRKSLPSLIAGLGVGALYAYSGHLLKNNAEYGLETAVAASALLLAGGIPRAIKTRGKPVPVALVALGTVSLGFFGKKWAEYNTGI